jgi:hypothetical protein
MDFKYDPTPFIFTKGDPYTKLCVLELAGLSNIPLGNSCVGHASPPKAECLTTKDVYSSRMLSSSTKFKVVV